MSISGNVVIITGAGSGLGRALAIGFVQRGAIVIGLGSRELSLKETSLLIGKDGFSYYVVDVSKADKVEDVMQKTANKFGKIDVLINSAAIYPKIAFLEQTAEDWMQTIAVNLGGVANCCRSVLPILKQQGSGRIINVGSFADLAPIPCSSAYAASKGGVRALTKAIAADLGGAYPGIICIEWIPGPMKTQMSNYSGTDPSDCVEWALQAINLSTGGRNSLIFEKDHVFIPAKSLKSRLKDKFLFWRK